ncbi:hypothetical protein AB0C33_45015 [Nonomuraea sp. NPDC048881]|uniref:hypothetical protein n=1 Tax=Nonomuraea sp. NPDC048881 TaxID=3155030 RepID=UPI003407B71F
MPMSATVRPPHSRLRLPAVVLLALLTAMAAMLMPVPAAYAASSTTCTGSSHATYNPGLTLTPQNVAADEIDTFSFCTSTDPTLTSGSFSLTGGTIPGAACNDVIAGPGGPLTVTWNNGQTSTAALTYVLTVTGGILQTVGTGTITAGELTGASAAFVWAFVLVNPLQCLAPGGLTTHDGTIAAQITSP